MKSIEDTTSLKSVGGNMKREFIEGLLKSIEDETSKKDIVEQIMSEYGKSTTANKSKIDELTEQLGLKEKENGEANKLIAELKKSNAGNEELQGKIGTYEEQLKSLKEENEALKLDNAIKVELLSAKAKGDDLDYLMFKIKQDNKDLSLTDDGKIKGLNVDEIKTAFPNNFEVENKKEVDVNELPKIENSDKTITKEQFEKMGYQERTKLYNDNPEVYKELSK